jgi:hypothetical protein
LGWSAFNQDRGFLPGCGFSDGYYDFIVAPGADPRSIRLRYTGISGASVDSRGDLHLATGAGEVTQHRPTVYQVRGGQRVQVSGTFRLINNNARSTEVAFAVAGYDKSLPLVIDPVLVYSTFLGGTGDVFGDGDIGTAIAVDSSGAAYVTGNTYSVDFPTTSGAFQTKLSGNPNAFVSKLSADGTALIYSTYLGGTIGDGGAAIAVDGSGAAYVAGYTDSNNFPVTAGAFQTVLYGEQNAFVTKLSVDGSDLTYSTYLGGSGLDYGAAIALDGSGDAYVTGFTQSIDFPTTAGVFQASRKGQQNAFVAKVGAEGSSLIYSTYLGGSNLDAGQGIAVDSSGFAYLTGYSGSSDFPTTAGAFQSVLKSRSNAFVSKLSANGGSLVYSTYVGGSNHDNSNGIAVDGSGAAYITGSTQSIDYPVTAGAFQPSLSGDQNAFFTKLGADGTSLAYSTYLGGSKPDTGYGIAVDVQGDAYITGSADSEDFPTTYGAYQTSQKASPTAFVTRFGANGNSLDYSTFLGGSGGDVGNAIAVDSSGSAYVTGYTGSPDFPLTPGAFQSSLNASVNVFISKMALGNTGQASATPTALSFGNVNAGSSSDAQVVTLSNESGAPMTVASIVSSDSVFAQTTTCGTSLSAGANCTVEVSFAPAGTGSDSGILILTTSEGTLTVALSGAGVAPPAGGSSGSGSSGGGGGGAANPVLLGLLGIAAFVRRWRRARTP